MDKKYKKIISNDFPCIGLSFPQGCLGKIVDGLSLKEGGNRTEMKCVGASGHMRPPASQSTSRDSDIQKPWQ